MKHGTVAGYSSGCRCTDCRAAIAAYAREQRRLKSAPKVARACDECGTEFFPRTRLNRFCSKRCAGAREPRVARSAIVRRGHPLAGGDGRILEHRYVLFEAIGPGEHPCHWCDTSVTWNNRTALKDDLVVDHLDGDPYNNSRENLVPACTGCNVLRGLIAAWEKRTGVSVKRLTN